MAPCAQDWQLCETELTRSKLAFYETLFTVGNGYICARGTLEEGHQECCPGTYLAGIYDKSTSTACELVNAPNPLSIEIQADGKPMNIDAMRVLEHQRTLHLRYATLSRRTLFEDAEGNRYAYSSLRYFSLADLHLGVLEVAICSLDKAAGLLVRSCIDARTENRVQPAGAGAVKHYTIAEMNADTHNYLEVSTHDAGTRIAFAAAMLARDKNIRFAGEALPQQTALCASFRARKGKTYRFRKLVAVYTSRDTDAVKDACLAALAATNVSALFARHKRAWERRWRVADIYVPDAATRKALRFNTYHLLIAAPPRDIDVSIGAKTLSGEWYKGHVFWDTEIYVLPFFIYTQPELARHFLLYRYRRLAKAREKAASYGYRGAFWPWESAASGAEETPRHWVNFDSTVIPVYNAERELHLNGAIVYAVYQYYLATADERFLWAAGLEMIFETARFWAARTEPSPAGSYRIRRVIGPNEFQDCVDDNAYTNFLAKWTLGLAHALYWRSRASHPRKLRALAKKLSLREAEVNSWKEIAERIVFPVCEDGLIEEFDGYFKLADVRVEPWDELPVPAWPAKIKFAEAKRTQLVKQADVVLLFHLFPTEFSEDVQKTNLAYYSARTVHKSSLSLPSYALVFARLGDCTTAYRYFLKALQIDLHDTHGNTNLGVHAAALGGVWQTLVLGFAGVRAGTDALHVNPQLPPQLLPLRLKLWYRGALLRIELTEKGVSVEVLRRRKAAEVEVCVQGARVSL